jgi:hypothetical protein
MVGQHNPGPCRAPFHDCPAYLWRRAIRYTIPEKADQMRNRKNKGRAGGRSSPSPG